MIKPAALLVFSWLNKRSLPGAVQYTKNTSGRLERLKIGYSSNMVEE